MESAAETQPAGAVTSSLPVRLAGALGPPLLAWLAARAMLLATAAVEGKKLFEPALWMRWDAHLYVLQSKLGPTLVACGRGSGYATTDWCGTAGWMPFYPLLIRGLAALGIERIDAAVLLAALFHLATLTLVWHVVRSNDAVRAGLALALAACFPGMIYAHAAFPISLIQFGLIAFVVATGTGRFARAGASGIVVSASHSTGVFVAPAAIIVTLSRRRSLTAIQRRRALLVPLLAAAGLASMFLWHHLVTGRWDAFFLVQTKYGHGLTWPWLGFLGSFTEHGAWDTLQAKAIALQTVASLLIVAGTVGVAVRHRGDPLVLTAALVTLAYWSGPLLMGPKVGFYRTEALLLPAVLVLARGPRWLLLTLLAAAIAVAPLVARVFFRGTLV